MCGRRFADRALDPEPVAHRGNFTERNTGLHHAERSGIHAEKEHAFAAFAVSAQIFLMRGPGVIERIVNEGYGRRETQAADGVAETLGGLNELRASQHGSHGESMSGRSAVAGPVQLPEGALEIFDFAFVLD